MSFTFKRSVASSAILLVLTLSYSNAAPLPINGDYCGRAVSGGEWVDVVTTLTTGADGLLSGSYKFDDNGEMAPGTLREDVKQSDDTRTMVWNDKYGTGMLVVSFAPSRSSFKGEWGVGGEAPMFGWTGERCNFDSVRNFMQGEAAS